ncbi:hypothetical protein [Sphingomonas japonica]|uniref:Uncharacterized protein n=1 Tax=Sphingomonas japonica TaxID=511662 RepID=A0ABX0U670_9SPHN|nr:hypothetical protein [Sphingomonas japonica]NIJ24832.1 hypothetical protein [Sphingomonas japonica]
MRKRVTWPAYLPDQIARDNLNVAVNVLPAANGYRPVKSVAAISEPLSATFRGGAAFISTDGTAYLLAGTANGLERYSAGAWSVLLTAMSVSGRWRFAQFGDAVIAVNDVETKVVDLNAGTAAALTDAPNGTSVAIVGPHVVIGQADGNKLLVQWSAFNDHTAWTPAVNQAGFQPMLDGGEVMGLAGGEYGIVLQRFALTRMSLSGDATAPFTFQQVTNNVGCASKASIVQAGRTVFFLSDRGFMALDDGAALRPIGNEKFDQSFRETVATDDYERLWAAVDPKRSLVMWGIPGFPGRIWVYNWVLDRASTIEIAFAGLFSGYESSVTLEELSVLYPDLDTMTISLDDPRFSGGDPRLYVVTDAQEVGALTGPNLEATLSLGWSEPFASQVARMRSLWPETDATDGVTVTIDARQRIGDVMDVQTGAVMQSSGRVPIRCRGRYMTFTVTHAAESDWSFDQGFDYDADAGGTR